MTRHPMGPSAAFGMGALIAAVVYSVISVVFLQDPTLVLGLWKSHMVTLEIAVYVGASMVCAVSFGIMLALIPSRHAAQGESPGIVALALGLIASFLGSNVADAAPDAGWLGFVVFGLVSAIAYNFLRTAK